MTLLHFFSMLMTTSFLIVVIDVFFKSHILDDLRPYSDVGTMSATNDRGTIGHEENFPTEH